MGKDVNLIWHKGTSKNHPFALDCMDAGDRATQEQLPRVCRSAILSDFHITRVTKKFNSD